MLKKDGSISIHSDDRAFKPLNWMLPPCHIEILSWGKKKKPSDSSAIWRVENRNEVLTITVHQIISDTTHHLAEAEPGLVRSWTEPHIQAWLAGHVSEFFGSGWSLIGREADTGAGPVDLLVKDEEGAVVAVEVKRTATMNAVDQVCRYVEALRGKYPESVVKGILVAMVVKPRARELSEARGIVWMEIAESNYRR